MQILDRIETAVDLGQKIGLIAAAPGAADIGTAPVSKTSGITAVSRMENNTVADCDNCRTGAAGEVCAKMDTA